MLNGKMMLFDNFFKQICMQFTLQSKCIVVYICCDPTWCTFYFAWFWWWQKQRLIWWVWWDLLIYCKPLILFQASWNSGKSVKCMLGIAGCTWSVWLWFGSRSWLHRLICHIHEMFGSGSGWEVDCKGSYTTGAYLTRAYSLFRLVYMLLVGFILLVWVNDRYS